MLTVKVTSYFSQIQISCVIMASVKYQRETQNVIPDKGISEQGNASRCNQSSNEADGKTSQESA